MGCSRMVQDMVEDRTRFRTLTVATAMFMYLLLVSDILTYTETEADTTIEKLEISSTLPAFGYLGEKLAHTPAVQALLATGDAVEGRTIAVSVVEVFVADLSGTVDCSTLSVEKWLATTRALRFDGVCEAVLPNSIASNQTSEQGDARFAQLIFPSAPPGLYTVRFDAAVQDQDAVNEPLHAQIKLLSTVLHLKPLQPPPPEVSIGPNGWPTWAQPKVLVLSDEWIPLPGKKVVIFSWPWPEFEMTESGTHHITGQQLALLQNNTAISDNNGIASFTALQITAATAPFTYLMLYCEGVVVSLNSESITGERAEPSAPAAKAYVPPILIASSTSGDVQWEVSVHRAVLLSESIDTSLDGYDCTGTPTNPSTQCGDNFAKTPRSCPAGCIFNAPLDVQEGTALPSSAIRVTVKQPATCTGQPSDPDLEWSCSEYLQERQRILRLCRNKWALCERHNRNNLDMYSEDGELCPTGCRYTPSVGIAGQNVIAMLASANGIFLPSYFETGGGGEGDPNSKQLLNPVSTPTNSDGVATFENLTFSTYGAAGLYRLAFAAGGQVSTSVSRAIAVATSVAEVRILTRGGVLLDLYNAIPAARVPGTSELLLRYPQTLTVQILSADGRPVAGKRVEVQLIDATDTLIDGASLVVDVNAAQEEGMSVDSGADGIATFPIKWRSLPNGVADPDCDEATSPVGCRAAGFRATVDGISSILRVINGLPFPAAYSPRHEAIEINDHGLIQLTCGVSPSVPPTPSHGDVLKLGAAMATIRSVEVVDRSTKVIAYPLWNSEPWGGKENSPGGLRSCGGTADDEDSTPDCGEAFAASVGAACPAGCTSHNLGTPTFNKLPEVSYACQHLEVSGLQFGKKVQADLTAFDDDDEEFLSRCLLTEDDTITARTPDNIQLQLCAANHALSAPENNCLHISTESVTTLADPAAPQRVPYFDESSRRLCFSGTTGTFSFKFSAWTTDRQNPACSSDVIHISWVSQTTFLSLDDADPRNADHYADNRQSPLGPSDTHRLNTEADLHAASDAVWLPILHAAAVEAADPYTDLYFSKPNEFHGYELIFYNSAYEQVYPDDIGDATIEIVGEPANVAPSVSGGEIYTRQTGRPSRGGQNWRSFLYEWGVIEFRTIVSRVDCLETATGAESDPVDKSSCDAVRGRDLADAEVCEAVMMNQNPEGKACTYPSYTFCGHNVCFRHFVAIIMRKGYAGEVAFVVTSEGATSPVVRLAVHNPVASLEIVTHMADSNGRVGMPLSTPPAIKVKDTDGAPLEGYSVMVTLTPTDKGDTETMPDRDTIEALDALLEIEPPRETPGSRLRSPAQFDMSMSSIENTLVTEGGCTATLDAVDRSVSAGNSCDPSQDNYDDFAASAENGVGANPACGLRERCCPADSRSRGCPANTCVTMFPESRGFRSSCPSDTEGVATFPSLTLIAGDPDGCYRPRYFYLPFRKTEFGEYLHTGIDVGSVVFSSYGAPICFKNEDENTIVTAPSTTLVEGSSGFSVAPVVRVTRPYHSEWLDPLAPSNNFAFITTLPVTISNSQRSFDVPAIAMNRFARKKLANHVCVIHRGGTRLGDCSLQSSSYYGLTTVEDGPETLYLYEVETKPQLRQAAPGEKIQLKFCDGGGLFGGGACSDLTQTITVTNEPTAVTLLNEPPLNIRISDIVEMRVQVTADGSPMEMAGVYAEIVHANGVAQTPVEFLMNAFLSVKSDSNCISPEHARAVWDQAIAVDLGAIVDTPGCSVLSCDACSDSASCGGVMQGACKWDTRSEVCLFAHINEDVVDRLKQNMTSQLAVLAGTTEADSIDCLKDVAKGYIRGYKAKLDPSRARGTTDTNGIAALSLSVASGMTGNYAIQFTSGAATATTKSFTVINSVQDVSFTTFDGLPSSGCNGWRLYDDTSATNCGTSDQYPLVVELPPISLRAIDLDGATIPRVPDLAIKLFVTELVPQEQLTFDEIIAEAKGTADSDDSASDKAEKAIALIIQGAKLLQPPSKTATSPNAYLIAGTVADPGPATTDFTPRFDPVTGVYTYTGLKMVVTKEGEYTIRSTFFGVKSGPAANSIVVETISTSTWEYLLQANRSLLRLSLYQVMIWMQRLILFAVFATIFFGNNAYEKHGEFDWTIVLALGLVLIIGLWINIQYYEQGWDSKLTYIILLADLILIATLLSVVLVGTLVGKSHFQHVERRRTAFYTYCRRFFNERHDLSWYHGRLNQVIVEEGARIAKKEVKVTSKLIESLEKKQKDHETDLAMQQDQLESYRTYVGLCDEIIRRAKTPHILSQGVQQQFPEFLRRSKEMFTLAHSQATEQLRETGGMASPEMLSTFAAETSSLSDMQGVPPMMFDLRGTRVVRLFARARSAAIRKRTQYVPQIKGLLKDTDAFYFPARIWIAFTLSAVTFTLCMTRFILIGEEYRHSIDNAQSKTKTQIFHFLSAVMTPPSSSTVPLHNSSADVYVYVCLPRSKMESLYYDQFGGELSDEAIEYAYTQADAVVDLFDELLTSFQVAFTIAMTLVALTFAYTQVQLFFDLRSQVLLARMGVETVATRMAHKIQGFDSVNFVGVSVANTTLALHLLMFIKFLLLFPFCWPMTYRLIYAVLEYNLSIILIVVVPLLVKPMSMQIAKRISYSKSQSGRPAGSRMITNRTCFGCFDVWSLFLALATGFGSAVVRIVLWIVIGLISILGLTESPLPAWFERYFQLDTGSKAFNAMVMQTIYHNNPIVNVFAWELMVVGGLEYAPFSTVAGNKEQKNSASGRLSVKRRQLRNRWQVAYTLVKNPIVRAERARVYVNCGGLGGSSASDPPTAQAQTADVVAIGTNYNTNPGSSGSHSSTPGGEHRLRPVARAVFKSKVRARSPQIHKLKPSTPSMGTKLKAKAAQPSEMEGTVWTPGIVQHRDSRPSTPFRRDRAAASTPVRVRATVRSPPKLPKAKGRTIINV